VHILLAKGWKISILSIISKTVRDIEHFAEGLEISLQRDPSNFSIYLTVHEIGAIKESIPTFKEKGEPPIRSAKR